MTNETTYWRRITLRLPEDLATEIDGFVDETGVTFTEFLRRACREKLDREKNPVPDISDDELDSRIEAILTRMIEEKKRKQ